MTAKQKILKRLNKIQVGMTQCNMGEFQNNDLIYNLLSNMYLILDNDLYELENE